MPPGRSPQLKVLLLYGTRPEAIKMAPVAAALRRRAGRFALTVATTAQHRDLLGPAEELLDLRPDVDLDLMRPDQTLNGLTAAAFAALDTLLAERAPDWLLVQGDTTTALAGAFAAFHRRVRVGHVEAGLRTGDLTQPFPEEANRRAVDLVADVLFAPTARARDALLREGVPAARVHLTGNTGIDALHRIAALLPEEPEPPAGSPGDGEVLITVHRRESFGAPLAAIFAAFRALALAFPNVRFIYPVHPNPNVREPAHRLLAGLANLELREPFDPVELVRRLRAARLVLTDSGGLQEEAPAFGKPVLVLREKTERPEGIDAGVAELVGTGTARIVAAAARLLTDEGAYRAMANKASPYGDGQAGERIAGLLAGETVVPFKG